MSPPSSIVGVVVAIAATVASCAVGAEDGATWKPVRHDAALDVWTRPVAGSQFDEVRVAGDICASLDTLTAYVQDVGHFGDWIPDTAEARLLAQPSASERLYYIRTDMPWPVKDRDMIYRLVAARDARVTTIAMIGEPDYLPRSDDAVRMTSVRGAWRIEPRDERTTHVVLEMRVEPGGSVPTWFARRRIVALPTGMIENLEREFARSCVTTPARQP